MPLPTGPVRVARASTPLSSSARSSPWGPGAHLSSAASTAIFNSQPSRGTSMANNRVTVMGSYVADLAFRIDHLPTWGETRMGQSFHLGPGGKGSNQAVAAARAGATVAFISKLGPDPFGEIA